MFILRFGMRLAPGQGRDERARLYGAALDMCTWAESRGCVSVLVSEHHGTDDGFLPSPVPFATAVAARTSTVAINVSALVVPFYEPVKLAEDLAVLDLVSHGRVSYVVGIGYRDEEFAMFGVDRRTRGRLVEERVALMRRLWAGETVEVDGRPVCVTPLPFTPGGPVLSYGGGSVGAARRAARLGMLLVADTRTPEIEAAYADEAARVGVAPVGCVFQNPRLPTTVFVADDPDWAWAELGEYLLRDAYGYGQWNGHRPGTPSVSFASTVDELRAENGLYRIMTPVEAGELVARGVPLVLQPLVGGLPPDVAWPYLEAAAAVSAAATPRRR